MATTDDKEKKAPAKSPVPDAEARNKKQEETAEQAAVRDAAAKIVDTAASALKEAIKEGETIPSGDGTFDTTPTPTQIQMTALKPTDPEGTEELKVIRHDNVPGQPPTTLKQEVKLVDDAIVSGDPEKDKVTFEALAKTQGINQAYVDGDELKMTKQDGTQFNDTLEQPVPENVPAVGTTTGKKK